ncbi:DoxX family protein [Quadrisphaera sp. DSM 44207]|uniref:DoxX family protein n=1 Tax=Quadrisphaera sp. DSM 44207 TaxID=1881057 RepID=UPI00088CE6FF|nr:DoxX family membrane protein [Quadrisphaera sp. DSM 44207]SDQ42295.1 putative oxidoreductase [Quadrisphaera sp. DSM 44207]
MTHDRFQDVGLLALRAGVGSVLAAHGGQKLFGWFGGGGVQGTAGVFEAMGFTPARPSALLAGAAEFGGGALIALGLATPAAGAAAAGTVLAAASVHAPSGLFATQGGWEYPAVLGLSTSALALTGPGELSLDAVLGHRPHHAWRRPARRPARRCLTRPVAPASGPLRPTGSRRRRTRSGSCR